MFLDNFAEPLRLTNHGIRLPEFKFPTEDYSKYGITKNSTDSEILRQLSRHGYKEKLAKGLIPKEKAKIYGERVNYELDILEQTFFGPYILLIWDVMNFVNKNNLAKGKGRGSASGSLINYLIDITGVDPIKYDLYFERFINTARSQITKIDGAVYLSSAPDIDIDLGDDDREKVIDYVANKYKGKFVKLSTQGTLTTKILTKELGKGFGYSEQDMLHISELIPMAFGKVFSPDKAREESEGYKKFIDENPLIYKLSKRLLGCINHLSSHASAYAVTFQDLDEFIPLQLGTDNEVISGYDGDEIQKLTVKLDLLGVQTINLIYNVARRVGLDLDSIDLESWDGIYKWLQNLEHSYGLFQISGHTALKCNNVILPKNIEEVSGLLSVARPGSLSFLNQYADYTNNGTIQDCPSEFYDILKATGGVCLYQESIMSLFVRIGFNLVDANTIREIVGKKKTDKMAEWEPKIFAKAKENGIKEESAKYLWDLARASADYSFCKCIFKNETVIHKTKGQIPLWKVQIGDEVLCFDTINNFDRYFAVKNIFKNKVVCYEVILETQETIRCSQYHQFLVKDNSKRGLRMVSLDQIPTIDNPFERAYELLTLESGLSRIVDIKKIGKRDTIDLEIDSGDHNFYCNNIVVSNSHSVSYSVNSLLSIFLKFNYSPEFFLECLIMSQKKQNPFEQINLICQELPYFNIKLLPPDLVKSEMDFILEGKDIRFGLSAIKNVAAKSLAKLQTFIDKDKANKFSVFHAAKESSLNIAILAALIQCGCLSSFSFERARMVLEAQIWYKLSERERNYCLTNGHKYNFDLIDALKDYLNWCEHDGKQFKQSRLDTIRKHTQSYISMYNLNKKFPEFAAYAYEKEMLGFGYSCNLRQLFSSTPDLVSLDEFKNKLDVKQNASIVVTVDEAIRKKSKKGQEMLKMAVSDETGQIVAIMMEEKLGRYLEHSKLPEEGDIIHLEGQKGDGAIFINRMSCHADKIAFKVGDLRKYNKKTDESSTEIPE